MASPFLEIPESEWVASNALAFAIRDGHPVSVGHTLVVPRREVASWFEATREEQHAIFELVAQVQRELARTLRPAPDGWNIGINAGAAAGQTVFHLHVHLIPRYRGDVDDPRGGVRHVIPSRGNYLLPARAAPLVTGGYADPLFEQLRPLFAEAEEIAIVAAFLMDTGLELLREPLFEAARGRRVRARILGSNYLDFTGPAALERLLDWTHVAPVEARVVDVGTAAFRARASAFHPKSWRFESPSGGTAFVGSSNVSESALLTGIEWNVRIERARDPEAYARIAAAFEELWAIAQPLDAQWIAAYAARRRPLIAAVRAAGAAGADAAGAEVGAAALAEEVPEAPPRAPEPHAIQLAALDALARTREAGARRALVVLATGLGKTWLAAFDIARVFGVAKEPGPLATPGPARVPSVLFLAHRAEILEQSARTLRTALRDPAPTFGWFAGDASELDADVVLAQVAKLGRAEHLAALRARLAARPFDYVVVDEAHHVAASSYQRILAALGDTPRFVLGLTATPDRADERDILASFDDHLAYRADLGVGIHEGHLVPFAYRGLRDDVDYTNIPWRNRRFDPALLAAAVQTESRMAKMFAAWCAHPATRTLVFCCSIPHAEYVRDWLRARGVRVAAVHSQPGSDDRERALADLAAARLDAVCTVDMFNEGIDPQGAHALSRRSTAWSCSAPPSRSSSSSNSSAAA